MTPQVYQIKNTPVAHKTAMNDPRFIELCEYFDKELGTTAYQTDPVNSGYLKFIKISIENFDYDLCIKVGKYFEEHGGWRFTARYDGELRFFID